MPKLILAADHAGFALKEKLKRLLAKDHDLFDSTPNFAEGDDYPDIAFEAGRLVARAGTPGIFICGSGEGMCICANKVKGVRAGIGYDVQSAVVSKQDNNTNVLCLAGRKLKEKDALRIVKAWLSSVFAGGRHERRIQKISGYERFRR